MGNLGILRGSDGVACVPLYWFFLLLFISWPFLSFYHTLPSCHRSLQYPSLALKLCPLLFSHTLFSLDTVGTASLILVRHASYNLALPKTLGKISHFLWISQFRTQFSLVSVGRGCKTRVVLIPSLISAYPCPHIPFSVAFIQITLVNLKIWKTHLSDSSLPSTLTIFWVFWRRGGLIFLKFFNKSWLFFNFFDSSALFPSFHPTSHPNHSSSHSYPG